MIYDCIIIGAGASGLFAGSNINLSSTGENKKEKTVRGLILEKNTRPARKLLMSGSGQCNITHSGSVKDFVDKYGSNGKKVRSCLYKYNNEMLVDFLNSNGVPTVEREDGKIFPASLKAQDVLNMLISKCRADGFKIECSIAVENISQENDLISIKTSSPSGYNTFTCRNLIVATGGCSYPTTGSDGSFFSVLKDSFGIEITQLKPALTPANVYDYPYSELSGISFRKAGISLWRNSKKVLSTEGDILFTHRNLSGPVVINNSRYMESGDTLKINYLHPLERNEVASRLNKALDGSRAHIPTVISREFGLPKEFSAMISQRGSGKTKEIAALLTEDTFIIKSLSGYNKAMATNGGIPLSQINCKTMEFKEFPSVYAIGECLDIDGETGGYNLQFAFSSAKAAVTHISEKLNQGN